MQPLIHSFSNIISEESPFKKILIPDENLGEEAMDNALRPALMKVGEDISIIPVRGPKEFINGEFKYLFDVTGDISNFNGIESIFKNNVKIYELKCNGGLIK